MDKSTQLSDPKYLRTKDINAKLTRIEETEKKVAELENRLVVIEKKVDAFLEFEKEKYQRILNDLKSE